MFQNLIRTLAQGFSRAIFSLSLVLLAFAVGFLFRGNEWFPYAIVQNAIKTSVTLRDQLSQPFADNQFIDFSGGDVKDTSRNRIVVRAAAPEAAGDEHFLMGGGIYQYLEYCPAIGCLAVEFSRTGALVHAYPYRPEQFEAHQIVSLPYETALFQFSRNMYPHGLLKLPGGDLIVILHQTYAFPFAGGIARVRPDGSVVWFRHDYSHHWPRLLPDGDIAVPAMRIGGSKTSMPLVHEARIDLDCDGSKIEEDFVRILDPDGQVKQEIPVFDAFLRSPYRGMLVNSPSPCDPLHLNYVAPVSNAMLSLYHDVLPDDLVISLFQINAFGILGRRDHRLKHLFAGTFVHQHSVQPVGQSASMLIFDDVGADWSAGPSRLLAYDLANHAERTLLPNPNAPGLTMSSGIEGNISVSPDHSRAIVASTLDGRAYEIRISDGRVLTVFNDIHDLRKVPEAGKGRETAAARFYLFDVEYVH